LFAAGTDQDDRLASLSPLRQEVPGQFEVRWLVVKPAVLVEQLRDALEVEQNSPPDPNFG
jgi:hypothetical protein